MDFQFDSIKPVPFLEYKAVLSDPDNASEFDIVIDGESSLEAYCKSLFQKIYKIEFSEISPFLKYQCLLYKDILSWLNSLEQLIKSNVELFDSKLLVQRKIMFTSLIDIKRENLQPKKEFEPKPKRSGKKPNCYSDDKSFCFEEDLAYIETLETTTEKIRYLNSQIADYTLFLPEYESNQLRKFDEQCNVKINHLLNDEKLQKQIEAEKLTKMDSVTKNPVNAELKAISYAFVQLRQKKGKDGKPILDWTTKQTVDYICNTLCEPDGTSYNPATVRTYLSPNNSYGRPKKDDEIDIDGLNL